MSSDSLAFEQAVRDVARTLWDVEPGDGSPVMIDGRERDFVYFGPEAVHYVECTANRTLEKVKYDAAKLVAFRQRHSNMLVRLWIVTKEEPTAHQIEEGVRSGIKVLSLEEFGKQLFDGNLYLRLRTNYPFGSASDPATDSSVV